jgi:hypothetical protein
MRFWLSLLTLLTLTLTGCASAVTNEPAPTDGKAAYPDLGPAPEISGETWLNTPVPLRLADLRGQVVLLDMWTFG